MPILTDSNSQLFRVDGCYALVLAPSTGGRKVLAFAQLTELATELYRRTNTYWYPAVQEDILGVVTPTGKLANIDELVRYGRRLREEAWAGRRYVGYVRRRGPVAGVRCYRGGGSYFRRIATTGERRQGCLVLEDEGEVAPRAKRNHTNLPNSWHDFCRTRERSWKSQHRGRKAWDRVRHGTDGGAE